MKKLLLGISFYFLANTNIMGAADVQRQILQIPLNPAINIGNNLGGIRVLAESCIRDISALPILQRDALYDGLARRVAGIAPTYTGIPAYRITIGPNTFNVLQRSMLGVIQSAREHAAREFAEARPQAPLVQVVAVNHPEVLPPPLQPVEQQMVDVDRPVMLPQLLVRPPQPLVLQEEVDERLDPISVIHPVVSFNTVVPVVAIDLPGHFVEGPNKDRFEARLISYVAAHWSSYYKPRDSVDGTDLLEAKLRILFDAINLQHRLFPARQRKAQVVAAESLLRGFYVNIADLIPTTADHVDEVMDNLQYESHVYTNMEKVRELPSVDWERGVQRYVLDNRKPLERGIRESVSGYWKRIGDHIIDIYTAKVKPHIYPDGLLADLNGNRDVSLIPLKPSMFENVADASAVFERIVRGAPDGLAGNHFFDHNILENEVPIGLRDAILTFDATHANLLGKDAAFKRNLCQSYKRINDYFVHCLVRLFGTVHPTQEGLSWEIQWNFGEEFSTERLELCRKVLLTFHYMDRPGHNFLEDVSDMGALAGRFTHCVDGKKTAIEAASCRAFCALSGDEDRDIVVEDFGAFIRRRALVDTKYTAITALSEHPDHHENVSMVAMIKMRNQDFWNFNTAVVPRLNHDTYTSSDYGFYTRTILEDQDSTDSMLRYIYQHVYVGPHELVNSTYKYLLSMNEHGRQGFFGFACVMLGRHRPFEDMMGGLYDYRPLVKARYCEPDGSTFTRKGIETLLFYNGYLDWDGPAAEHPLKVDWDENIAYLKRTEPEIYARIYNDDDF